MKMNLNGKFWLLSFVLLTLTSLVRGQIWAPNTNYLLKWVTNKQTEMPVWLEHKKRVDADYKWFKYSEHAYVDDIVNYQDHYAYSDTPMHTKLYIMNYDARSHEQLSTYEPKIVAIRNENPAAAYGNYDGDEETTQIYEEDQRDLYTLAYLKSHRISVEQSDDRMNISCSVVVIIPQNDEDINEEVYRLLESNIHIRMRFNSNHSTYVVHNEEFSADQHKAGNNNKKRAGHHAGHNHHHHHKKHKSYHTRRTTLQRKVVVHRSKRALNTESETNTENKGEANTINEFFRKLVGLGDSTDRVRRQIRSSSQESAENESTRFGEKIVLTNLIEVELREGPISVFREFNDKSEYENISCQLDLIDYDRTSAYHNKIYRIIRRREGGASLSTSSSADADADQSSEEETTSSEHHHEHDLRAEATHHHSTTISAADSKQQFKMQMANTGAGTMSSAEIWPIRAVESLFFKFKISHKFKCMIAFFVSFTLFNLILKLNHNIQYWD